MQVGDRFLLPSIGKAPEDNEKSHGHTLAAGRSAKGAWAPCQTGGSLVEPDRLRFDFMHFAPMTSVEMQAVEDDVNREIQKNVKVAIEQMDWMRP